MTFPALAEVQGTIDTKAKELHEIFELAGPDIDLKLAIKNVSGATNSHDVAAHIRKLNDELTDLGIQRDNLKGVEAAALRDKGGHEGGADTKDAGTPGTPNTKSLGELFVKSAAFTRNSPEAHLDIDLKTLMTTSLGWAPEVLRNGRVVDFATRPIQVIDILPQTTTRMNAVKFMEETTFTNAAAETAEGGTYAESALALTERLSPVQKIGTFLPLTDEQLEDVEQAQGYVNNRLPFMIRQRLDAQVLVGNGTTPNLRGILNVVGIQTQAKGVDPTPDAFYKAMVNCQVTGQAFPNAAIIHPLDWQDVRLLRTADGIYIWGNPSDAGPERIWGLGVVQAQAITQNTGLVGDFANFSELSVRSGVDVQTSNSHGTFFVEGKQAVRADVRCAMVVYRPAAFCTVTGI